MKTTVYIETFGCQMNVADSERAATVLKEAGYDLVTSAHAAEVVLLNTCSVRERAERKVYTRVGDLRGVSHYKKPLIGVMGCVAQLEGAAIFDHAPGVNMVVGTRATDRIPSLIKRLKSGEETLLDLGERAEEESWNVSSVARHSQYVAFVPIIEGCNKFCSFCIVPYSRGREISRTAKDVIEEVIKLRDLGYKEIHLIGQNVNSYRPRLLAGLEQSPGATPFCRLLRAVADTGVERIKFATSFPRDFHPDIVSAIEEYSNLCNWIHLPVQSGSDHVLKLMRRGHTAADYLSKVEAIKKSKRRLALTTDIIVGFPGETDHDFRSTMKLVEECEFDGLYLFKYSRRAGTPAAKLIEDVSESVKKTRFLELESHHRQIQNKIYSGYLGSTLSVLVEAESARSEEDMMGHSTCHKVVNFKGETGEKGRIVDVMVTEAKVNSLYGQRVNAMARSI